MTETETASSEEKTVPAVLTGVSPAGASGETDGKAQAADLSTVFSGIPSIGAYRTADHRYYWNGNGPQPGVTGVLGVLDKPAIIQWAKRTVAEIAVMRWEELGGLILKEGNDAAIKWLSSLPDYQKDTAAKLGSGVHLLADMASRAPQTGAEAFQVSEQEKPYLDAFLAFLGALKAEGAEIVSSEKMIWSVNGYGGTYDLIVRDSAGVLWMLDIKTSKGTYPETALQLVAYGYADQIILEGNPDGYPMPLIQKYGVLHLRPDLYLDHGYRLIQYPVTDSDYIAFLGALEIWRWKQESRFSKKILGKGSLSLNP